MLDMSGITNRADTFHMIYKFRALPFTTVEKGISEIFGFNRRLLNAFTTSCTLDVDTIAQTEQIPCDALDDTTVWREVVGKEYQDSERIIDPEIELTDPSK